MKKIIKAALFCAAAAGFIPYDLRKTDEGEVQSRSLFLEIRKKETSDGETQVQVSFPMLDQLSDLGQKVSQRVKQTCEDIRTAGEEAQEAEYTACGDCETCETPDACNDCAACENGDAAPAEPAEETPAEPCENAFNADTQPAEAL